MNITITFSDLSLTNARALLAYVAVVKKLDSQVEEVPVTEEIEITAPSFEVDTSPIETEEEKPKRTRKPRNTAEKIDDLPPPPPIPPQGAPGMDFTQVVGMITKAMSANKFSFAELASVYQTFGAEHLMVLKDRPETWQPLLNALGLS